MSCYYLLLCMLLATLQVVTGFDTSYYKTLSEPDEENFAYFSDRCVGLGENWAATILETTAESQALDLSLRQGSCQECWIGDSPNLNQNYEDLTDQHRYTISLNCPNVTNLVNSKLQTDTLNCAICERTPVHSQSESEGLVFASTTSNYQILDNIDYSCTALGDGWNNVILETEEELNFVINSMPFFPAHYHGKFILGGSTNEKFPSCDGSIEFSNYLSDSSGQYHVYLQPITAESYLPANATYDPNDEILFPSADLVQDAGRLCEKEITTDGLEFVSGDSYYQVLISSSNHDYMYWSEKCTELGDGWAPAVLDREKELRFIKEGDRGLSNISSYWIGGSTYLQPSNTIQYSEYYNIEEFAVSGLIFTAGDRFYRKLVGFPDQDYAYWSERCTELGNGWAPATFDSNEELASIREGQKELHDIRNYFIGGSTKRESSRIIQISHYLPNKSGMNNVFVTTKRNGQTSAENFRLRSSPSTKVLSGILCEIGINNVFATTIGDETNNIGNFRLQSQRPSHTLPGILCEKENAPPAGTYLASSNRRYRKLSVGNTLNKKSNPRWAHRCTEIGDGWGGAHLRFFNQRTFIMLGQKTISNSLPYWIGETGPLNIVDEVVADDGSNGNFINTTFEFGVDRNTFRIEKQDPGNSLDGILCEKEMNSKSREFESATSYYRKLSLPGNFRGFYNFWVHNCTQLGAGWSISFLETEEEYDFVIFMDRFLTGPDFYLIGGSPGEDWNGDVLELFGYSLYTTKETNNYITITQVFAGTQLTGNTPTLTYNAALCEKAKA